MKTVFHLGVTQSDLAEARVALLPGDPDRVAAIAAHLEDARPLQRRREFNSWCGRLDDQPVVVCSTGIGGPSTSIAVEELAQLGVGTFIRVGTTGAIQPDIEVGDVIVSQAAIRLDGASTHFAPLAYPAVADFDCLSALVGAARQHGYRHHVGISVSSDTFYPGQERYDTVSGYVPRHLRGSADEWRSLGALNYEMESATLFTMCAANRWRAGMVTGVLVNRSRQELPAPDAHQEAERRAIQVGVEAARQMARST